MSQKKKKKEFLTGLVVYIMRAERIVAFLLSSAARETHKLRQRKFDMWSTLENCPTASGFCISFFLIALNKTLSSYWSLARSLKALERERDGNGNE